MITTLQNIWTWLDGKKSTLGGIMLFISMIIINLVIGQLKIDNKVLDDAVIILNYFGGILLPTGLIHKVYKSGFASGVKSAAPPTHI